MGLWLKVCISDFWGILIILLHFLLYSAKICPIGHSFFNKNISEHWLTVGRFQQPKYVNSRQSMTKYYRNLKILCRNPLSSLFDVANTSKSGMQVSVLFSQQQGRKTKNCQNSRFLHIFFATDCSMIAGNKIFLSDLFLSIFPQ